MILRIDRLPAELPQSPEIDAVATSNVQELYTPKALKAISNSWTRHPKVDALREGGDIEHLAGIASSFASDCAPQEIMKSETRMYAKAKDL